MSANETPRLTLTLDLTDDAVALIKAQIALAFAEYEKHENGWMDTERAAAYIGSPVSRIYDLKAQGRLTPAHDGTRLKFRRSDLDAYMEQSV